MACAHTLSRRRLGAPPEQGLRSSLRGQAPRRGRGARWNLASDSLRGPRAAALGEPLRGPCPGHASPPPERPDPTGPRSAKSSPPPPAALGPAGPGAGPRRSEAAEVARRAAECSGNEKPPLSRGHRGRELRRAATPRAPSPPTLSQARRTTPAPARTGAGRGAASSAQRLALGRVDSRAGRPRSRLRSGTRT
ncbi:atherin-like [Vulpes lagopus]|uniref:atherin-like n=1 Tax=Vulpes lagopus TaxID=494514 RepID=UPI001BC9EF16|nr:atherin-like [Vulpes lagopus]